VVDHPVTTRLLPGYHPVTTRSPPVIYDKYLSIMSGYLSISTHKMLEFGTKKLHRSFPVICTNLEKNQYHRKKTIYK